MELSEEELEGRSTTTSSKKTIPPSVQKMMKEGRMPSLEQIAAAYLRAGVDPNKVPKKDLLQPESPNNLSDESQKT